MYYIYHIPGIKVGCTENFSRRCLENRSKYGTDITIELLETVNDIKVADQRENDYSKMLGYGELEPHQRYSRARKFGKSYAGTKQSLEHIEKRRLQNKGKKRTPAQLEVYSQVKQKEKHNHWNTGRRIKDLISGFEGNWTETIQHFNFKTSLEYYIKKGAPVRKKDGTVVHLVEIDTPSL